MGGIKGLFKGNFAFFTKINCFALSILWFARFPTLERVHFGSFEFWLAPCDISSVLIGTRDQKPLCIFFRELTRVHTWGKPKGKQKWLSFFFFTFQEVTWAKMWIRRRWPNSINRWPRWWTPGSSNKWVRVQCDQPEFFNKFLCMKTFLLQWNSLLQLHHSYTDNYAVVTLSKIRHKWRWYTQEDEAFYWPRRLPNSAFADIYRMIGLRSRYPFY